MRRKADAGTGRIQVTRYAGPEGPAETWSVDADGADWVATSPNGSRGACHGSPTAALESSGACHYVPGVGLYIRTGGVVSPFELLPALQSWTEPDDGPVEAHDRWGHEALSWAHEAVYRKSGDDQFQLDSNRIIRIDDGVCAVHQPDRDRSSTGSRHLVIFEETDPLWPAFFEEWATTTTDNGYGSAHYATGEITPGFQGAAFDADEIGSLFVRPLPEGHTPPQVDEMVSWIAGNVSMTAGFGEFELEVDGGSVTAVFPEGGPYGEASGSLGPAVRQTQGQSDE